jgi:hypothetical protein
VLHALPEKAQSHAAPVRNQPKDTFAQRKAQFAALFLLRNIRDEGVDDSQYLHSLTYVDLTDEQFRDITDAELQQLERIITALDYVDRQRSAPETKMRSSLTAEQFAEYVASFDLDISHVESDETDQMPYELTLYMDKVREGDRYTRISNLFRRSKKRDMNGRTAFGRYEQKAETAYESAVMMLTNLIDTNTERNHAPDYTLSAEIQRFLDRDVNCEPGHEPNPGPETVPRIRGSKSRYTQMEAHPVVGTRLRKHWRQREALSKAALELLYAEPEEVSLDMTQSKKLRELLRKVGRDT